MASPGKSDDTFFIGNSKLDFSSEPENNLVKIGSKFFGSKD